MDNFVKREKIFEHIKAVCLEGDNGALITSEDVLKMAIKNIPSDEPKQGEWIEEIYLNGHTYGTCSNCLHVRIQDNYCPNCGAKMKGADDE